MLKSANEMNKVASKVREAHIAQAKAESEAYVNDVIAKAIERKANEGGYSVDIYINKTNANAHYVANLLRDAGYEVKKGIEILTVTW